MIRSEKEYAEAVERIGQEKERLSKQEAALKDMSLGPAEVKRALDPMRSFHQQLEEEVSSYERLKRGQFDEISNLGGIGQLLVSLRIARGLTQRQFAERLGVHETQVSRDERNEYHGITLERAARILNTLHVEVRSRVEVHQEESSVA
jgi:DNA-directed RNA polymerase specialized sigma subunit